MLICQLALCVYENLPRTERADMFRDLQLVQVCMKKKDFVHLLSALKSLARRQPKAQLRVSSQRVISD